MEYTIKKFYEIFREYTCEGEKNASITKLLKDSSKYIDIEAIEMAYIKGLFIYNDNPSLIAFTKDKVLVSSLNDDKTNICILKKGNIETLNLVPSDYNAELTITFTNGYEVILNNVTDTNEHHSPCIAEHIKNTFIYLYKGI